MAHLGTADDPSLADVGLLRPNPLYLANFASCWATERNWIHVSLHWLHFAKLFTSPYVQPLPTPFRIVFLGHTWHPCCELWSLHEPSQSKIDGENSGFALRVSSKVSENELSKV